MPDPRIIDWDSVKDELIGRTVAELEKIDVVSADVKEAPHLSVGGIDLTLSAGAKLAIRAYNDAKDSDDEQVVGARDSAIPFEEGRAWLRYSLLGEVTSEARQKLRAAGIGVSAQSHVVLSDYRRHLPGDHADAEVLSDLAHARSALIADDVISLGSAEALRYEVRGDLRFSLSVAWSDVYAKTLAEISSALPASRTFAVAVHAGATAAFKVTLTDDFVLVFWRDASGALHVGVQKGSSSGRTGAATVGVSASFADPDAIAAAAEGLLDGYFGAPLKTIEGLLAKAEGAELTRDEKRVFDAAVDALGLDEAVARIDEVRVRLAEIRESVESKIAKAAAFRIAAGWKYEYSRTESSRFIVEAQLSEEQLRQLHPSLAAHDVSPLLAEADRGALRLERYLDEATTVRTSAHGFSLGIGKWLDIGDRDRSTLTVRTRRSRDGRSMISTIGTRSFGGAVQWSIGQFDFDFRAEMADYAAEPVTTDFAFGLSISMTDVRRNLTAHAMATIADTAALWSISGRRDEVREQLAKVRGRTATARYALTFDEDVLRQIAPPAAAHDADSIAEAVAAAMPWGPFPSRSRWEQRRDLYAPAWRLVLGGGEAQQAYDAVRRAVKAEDPAMAQLDSAGSHLWTLRSLVDGHPKIATHYERWSSGAERFGAALDTPLPATTIETMFEEMYDFFSQALYVRAIGRHLCDLALRAGCLGKVTRVLSIECENKALTIGAKAEEKS